MKAVLSPASQEIIKGLSEKYAFEDESIPDAPYFISVAAPEKRGKSHLCLTASLDHPVFLADTENRIHHILNKFKTPAHKPIRYKVTTNYEELYLFVLKAIGTAKRENLGRCTIIVDSGSDLKDFAETLVCRELEIQQIFPAVNWGKVWAYCDLIIDTIVNSGHNLIITSRVKDEYNGDNKTGKQLPDFYKKIPYKATFCFQYKNFGKGVTEDYALVVTANTLFRKDLTADKAFLKECSTIGEILTTLHTLNQTLQAEEKDKK